MIELCGITDIPDGECRMFQVCDSHIAICNVGGTLHAIDNICPHRGAFLGQGTLNGSILTCPWHEWKFDVTSGKGITNPLAAVRRHKIVVENDTVLLAADD